MDSLSISTTQKVLLGNTALEYPFDVRIREKNLRSWKVTFGISLKGDPLQASLPALHHPFPTEDVRRSVLRRQTASQRCSFYVNHFLI